MPCQNAFILCFFHLLTSAALHFPCHRTQARSNRPSSPTVCDYCSTGDLYTYWQMIGQFSEDTVRVFAAELGCALGGYPTRTQAIKMNDSDFNLFFQKCWEIIEYVNKFLQWFEHLRRDSSLLRKQLSVIFIWCTNFNKIVPRFVF